MKLEVRNATMGYGKKVILEEVNITLNKGEIVSVLGQNGAGKTTLFKTLLGILPTLKGDVWLDNKKLNDWSTTHYAQHVAYIPQAKSLPFPYRVFDVVLFGRSSHIALFSTPGRRDKERAERALDSLGIAHLKDKTYTNLSGGEQQMVIIARALVQEPDFLIMDEPTSNLDFGNQITILNQINKLKKEGVGIIMATHSPDHVFLCQSKVLAVKKNRVYAIDDFKNQVNEKFITDIYGVDVKIGYIEGLTTERKVCIPLL